MTNAFRSDFTDSRYWDELIAPTKYNLPAWDVPPTPHDISKWLYRLDVEDYPAKVKTSPEDMIRLNPDWPLRAFVGLMLEYRAWLDCYR